MKATLDTKEFREALERVNYIPKDKRLATLADVHISFKDGKAVLKSTDLQQVIQVNVKAVHDEEVDILIDRRTALRFVQGGNGNIKIASDKPRHVLLERGDIGVLKLYTNDARDYPPMPTPPEIDYSTIETKWFLRMIDIAISACADDTTRPILNGIWLQNGKIASANGFRLVSIKSDNFKLNTQDDKNIIVPQDTAKLLKRLFGKTESINIGVQGNKIYFESDSTLLMAELIQGSYPAYEQLIPDRYNSKIKASAPLLLQRLKLIDDVQVQGNIVRLLFRNTKKKEQIATIRARAEDSLEYDMSMPIKIEGDESKIAVNRKYLMDAIKPFSMVDIELTSLSSPLKITGDVEELTVVVMPMFVKWD